MFVAGTALIVSAVGSSRNVTEMLSIVIVTTARRESETGRLGPRVSKRDRTCEEEM